MDVKTKKKKTNWSKNEFETLVSEYENKFDVLEGDLSVSLIGSDKRTAWESVMEWTRKWLNMQSPRLIISTQKFKKQKKLQTII
ncbi:hypothetical protein DPMN_155332 [Dreissena polymorpha]|uniref:Myb/SANT-like DNA-binding domain-containing protein n=1 Tax=Dreissena polymorpha TaxID=45954 RepID=A0A9D4FQ56_DREPO|nr:hypothetical protein DPMN_155332 [Dreissena polymorpha]